MKHIKYFQQWCIFSLLNFYILMIKTVTEYESIYYKYAEKYNSYHEKIYFPEKYTKCSSLGVFMKKVIIIGAGPAGLTAALELSRTNEYEIIILEESRQIGGISKTVEYKENRMDMGGHRFFSKSDRVNSFWNEIMPMEAPEHNPDNDDEVMLRRKRVSGILYDGKYFDYPISINKGTIKNMGLWTTIRIGLSYFASVIHKKPETNLENFYINRFGKKLYRLFFETYTENLWGRHPREIDASWGSQRVKGLSAMTLLKNRFKKNGKEKNTLSDEFKYPKYGPGQMWETVAQRVQKNGGNLLLGARVTGVSPADGYVTYIENGEQLTIYGDYIISSMPVKDLISAMENVPANIYGIAGKLPYRDYMILGVLVKNFRLKNKRTGAVISDCWIYVQDTSVRMGRIQIYNNWSPYLMSGSDENVWLGLEYFVNEGDRFWNMGEAEFADFAIEEMIKINVISDKEDVLDYHLERIKKAYPAYYDTYKDFDKVTEYLDSFEKLYCIGRNGQHRYNNMDHSMLTAMQAVRIIRGEENNKKTIWDINTERVYHESR